MLFLSRRHKQYFRKREDREGMVRFCHNKEQIRVKTCRFIPSVVLRVTNERTIIISSSYYYYLDFFRNVVMLLCDAFYSKKNE